MLKVLGTLLALAILAMLGFVLYMSFNDAAARSSFYNGIGLGVGIGFGLLFGIMSFNWFVGFLDRVKSGKL
ncbi:hypothetical protein KDL44_12425 [bacterium]|nr:hypothetical protein [bacterium]